jgi:hypothetical protein
MTPTSIETNIHDIKTEKNRNSLKYTYTIGYRLAKHKIYNSYDAEIQRNNKVDHKNTHTSTVFRNTQ